MMREMIRYRAWKVVSFVVMVILAIVVFGFVTMHLWNWLMPPIFGLPAITFVQALGLMILGKILFGGFHRHSGGRRGWKRHMNERWEKMSPEDRERFRTGMRERWYCRPDPSERTVPAQAPQ